jgi:RHS repeat-associated protein
VHGREGVWRHCIDKYPQPNPGPGPGPIDTSAATAGTARSSPSRDGKLGSASTQSMSQYAYAFWPKSFGNQALMAKTIHGPGLAPMRWSYGYGGNPNGSWSSDYTLCTTCTDSKFVYVTDPRGVVTRYQFGTRFHVNEGQLLRQDDGWDAASGTAQRTTTKRYVQVPGAPEPIGFSGMGNGDYLAIRHRPVDLRVINQQGVNFHWQVNEFETRFARAVDVSKWSSLGASRRERSEYFDFMPRWVLGQIRTVTELNTGRVMQQNDFDGNGLPVAQYQFGLLQRTLGFNNDGTIAWAQDALGRRTHYSQYMRGLAQRIDHPDGRAETAQINNLGLITRVTNEAGTTRSFGYDAMGRLASIQHPAGDPTGYHATTLSFEQVGHGEYGIDAGHWRQTIATGNARTVRYFDALWRERMSDTYDLADVGNTRAMVETRWDSGNRKTFESYAHRWISTVGGTPPGIAQTYDPLGRPTGRYQDSELGVLTTRTEYLGGFQRRTTSPRGHATTQSFQVFDSPTEDRLANIWAPEGATVTIARDLFGKATAITRSGHWGGGFASATRSYVYDAHQRLCKTIEPETGATVQQLDAAGNLSWRASGLALPSTTSCDHAAVPGERKISHGYDSRNRLVSTVYGDGSPAISRGYTADGLLETLSSGGSTWTYGYNQRRLLVSEALDLAGSRRTYQHGIDAYGHAASLSYPGGPTVAYSPDALGRPTQVSGYAGGIRHHANGMLAGYTLANGVVHSRSQNTRGLPQGWSDSGVLNDAYSFDANGNVSSISDHQEGVNHRAMGYDGLDRLVTASGPWGSASYGYDPIDNLRSSQVGGRSLSHQIDAASNRLMLITGSQHLGIAYDANGNIIQRGAQGFSFDIGNRLSAAHGRASYGYDGHGRRTSVNFTDGRSRQHAYSQSGRLLTTWHSHEGTTHHVWLGAQILAETQTGSGTRFLHADALGSPVAASNAAGQVISRTRYEPYGATAGGTHPTGIGFTGHVNDADTGLVYMQQRYYEPLAGRFLSVDPVVTDVESGAHFGRYHYANNNPYRFVDPDGRRATECGEGGTTCKSMGSIDAEETNDLGVVAERMGTGGSKESTGYVVGGVPASEDVKQASVVTLALIGGAGTGYVAVRVTVALWKGVVAKPAATGVPADAVFAQKTYSAKFSTEGSLAGKSVDDVTALLRTGEMKPGDIPVNYIVRDGQTIILNTRSAQALESAGIPRSQWNGVNQTGSKFFEKLLDSQMRRNPGGPFESVRRGTP